MDTQTYNEFKQALLMQIQHFSPDGAAYQKAVNSIHETEKDTRNNTERYKRIIHILTDGVTYGNWPWSLQ